MNIVLRKMAMLEQEIIKKEEEAKVMGYPVTPTDTELRNRVFQLMNRVRAI